ncbi:hypothetical protein [Umezawaea sp. Da 62-37]|uniref:hypothetical protein n=1 Tax=Umezawaea sp. Da 62-37 TaxID=3075927 RepID=UPI0028F6EADA|nr:hypothetical protein [Umezawaea sp. Da 62-37]WNV84932.1 hypothetical protein RM788_43385 [Umezawaea sp. Da 62-37]
MTTTEDRSATDFAKTLQQLLALASLAEQAEATLTALPGITFSAPARAALATELDTVLRRTLAEGLRTDAGIGHDGKPSYDTGSWRDAANRIDRALDRD